MEKIISQQNLEKLVEKLSAEYDVFAPVVRDKFSEFSPVKNLKECNLEILNTTKPLKQLFLPQSERLFSIERDGEKVTLDSRGPLKKKRIILGAKSCEVKGLELLANVYGSAEHPDELFLDRKKNTIIIGLTCDKPADTCFCIALGVNPVEEKGMDIVLTKINGEFVIKSFTRQGEDLLKEYGNLLEDASKEELDKKKKLEEVIPGKQNVSLDLSGIKSKLDNGFDHPVWEEENLRCIACGACAYLCPVCQCFDIHDETGKGGALARYRTWDTCMSPDFTQMAGGHNPRAKKRNRFRQRFMHKFKYYPDLFNTPGCTGCGRCIQFCPVNIDIVELLKKL